MKTPNEIIEIMLKEDAFSKLLGLKLTKLDKGTCVLQMDITPDHVNGFNITHGGVGFSLADSAVAFAANAYGYKAVTIENSISYIKPSFLHSILIASCTELHKGKTIGRYAVKLNTEDNKLVAQVNATVHFSQEAW